MSDEKKKDYICFRYRCKHGFVPSASFFIGSSESDRPWEEIYLGSLIGFFCILYLLITAGHVTQTGVNKVQKTA